MVTPQLMSTRNGRVNWINFRTDDDLDAALDDVVEGLKLQGYNRVSRSTVARQILRKELGIDPVQAEVQESIKTIHSVTASAISKLSKEISKQLPALLAEELNG